MADNQFPGGGVDERFRGYPLDERFRDFPADNRFFEGRDTRFEGADYGWTPERLFANGQRGVFWDFSDRSKLFTDDGLTNITADGQAIYRADDKSGNGNHLRQATLGLRMLYKTDGTYHWALPDGVDDYMQTAAFASAIPQPAHYVWGGQHDLVEGRFFFDGIVSGSRQVVVESSAAGVTGFSLFAGAEVVAVSSADAGNHTFSALFNGASSRMRIDGVDGSLVNPGTSGISGLTLGARFNGASPLSGRIGPFVMREGEFTGAELARLEDWISRRVPPNP